MVSGSASGSATTAGSRAKSFIFSLNIVSPGANSAVNLMIESRNPGTCGQKQAK
jgi:hypothetical protein